jgi:DNA-binding CsgD family transcriptional regulator
MANSGVLNYDKQDGCCCDIPHLTARHLDVLEAIAAGRTTAKAAIALKLSEATVKSHIANMMAIAGVHKRAELITLAIAQGILQVQHPHQRTGRTCLSPRRPAGLQLQVPAPAIAPGSGDGTTVTTVRSG